MMIENHSNKKNSMLINTEIQMQRSFFLSSQKLSTVINDIFYLRKKKGDKDWLQRFLNEAMELMKHRKDCNWTKPESKPESKAESKLKDIKQQS